MLLRDVDIGGFRFPHVVPGVLNDVPGVAVAPHPTKEIRPLIALPAGRKARAFNWRLQHLVLSGFQQKTLAVVGDLHVITWRLELANPGHLSLDPLLHVGDLVQPVRDLKPLELADNLGRARVLVEVDNRQPTLFGAIVTGELLGSGVADIDEGKIGEEHAEERQAGGDVVMKTSPKDFVVLGGLDDCLEHLEHLATLGRYGIPRSAEAGNG